MTMKSGMLGGAAVTATLLLAGLALGGLTMAGAAAAETLDRIRQDGAIRIAYREDAPPFSLKGEGGTPAGYSVELCRAVADDIKRQLNLAKLDVRAGSVRGYIFDASGIAARINAGSSSSRSMPSRGWARTFTTLSLNSKAPTAT